MEFGSIYSRNLNNEEIGYEESKVQKLWIMGKVARVIMEDKDRNQKVLIKKGVKQKTINKKVKKNWIDHSLRRKHI